VNTDPPNQPAAPVLPDRPRPCLLVVDDQLSNIQTVGTLLHAEGYDVMSATSAEQALQRLRARRPDLLLLDMMMPGTSGLELCRVLMAKPSLAQIPVIFLSAADEVSLITAALEAGAVDYVTKPFRRAELLGRIRTHIALKTARDDLQRIAEEKDELLNLMAHDLKNGLAAVRLHSEFLLHHGDPTDTTARPSLEKLAHESARLLDCVNALLASQTAGPQLLRFEIVDVAALVGQTVDAHRPLAEAKNQRIELEAPDASTSMAQADPSALRQVIDNVLSNAVKFSPHGSVVWVKVMAGTDDTGPVIQVRDEGPGFTTDDLQRAFRHFGRLSARPTGSETSTGLGLSIVKKLTTRMGGTVALDSAPGAGAEVTIRLPAVWRPVPPAPASPANR
jgi:two-component system sensor histidine kinase/response regulator